MFLEKRPEEIGKTSRLFLKGLVRHEIELLSFLLISFQRFILIISVFRTFDIFVDEESLKEWGITYRLVAPGYELYGMQGLFQRNLSDFLLWNGDYLLERLAEPGGVARYLAEMLVQCYNNLPFGALLLAMLLGGLQQMTWLLMRKRGCQNGMRSYLLSFVTPIIIWMVMGDKDVMTTFPMAIWAALGLIVYDLVKRHERSRLAMLLLAVVIVGMFVQLASARMLPYPKSRVFRGIDYLRDPMAFFPHEWYCSDVYEQMDYSMLVRRQDWQEILDKANRKTPQSTAGFSIWDWSMLLAILPSSLSNLSPMAIKVGAS